MTPVSSRVSNYSLTVAEPRSNRAARPRSDEERGGVLTDVLPPLIHIDRRSSEASRTRGLLDPLVKVVSENRPGANTYADDLPTLVESLNLTEAINVGPVKGTLV